MKSKLCLALAALTLTTATIASPYYVSVAGGLAAAMKDSNSLYNSQTPMNTGFDLAAAVGYTFRFSPITDYRLELQYMHTHNAYSNNLKTLISDMINTGGTSVPATGGTANDALGGNYIMANALFDWKFAPKFTGTFGVGLGYAHLSALINNPTATGLPSDYAELINAENTWAASLILGGQFKVSRQIAVGVNYEALLTSSIRAGQYLNVYNDGSTTITNGMLVNNLVNLNLTYHLPM